MPKSDNVPVEGQLQLDAYNHHQQHGQQKSRLTRSGSIRGRSGRAFAFSRDTLVETVQQRKKRASSEEAFLLAQHKNYQDHTTRENTPVLEDQVDVGGGREKPNGTSASSSVSIAIIDGKTLGLKSIYQSIQKRVLKSKLLRKSPCVTCRALPDCLDRKCSDLSDVSLPNSSSVGLLRSNSLNPNKQMNDGAINKGDGGPNRPLSANSSHRRNNNQRKTSPSGVMIKKG